jgi:hypothetical protein
MDAADRSLVLRIDHPEEPIEGEARSGDGRTREFSSWMELVALIETWQSEESDTPNRAT